MTPIQRRIAELEAKKPAVRSAYHRVIVEPDCTLDEAVEAYGRDKIGPDDRLIVRTIVDAPRVPTSPPRLEVVR